jgi:hypothetical protein
LDAARQVIPILLNVTRTNATSPAQSFNQTVAVAGTSVFSVDAYI